MRPFPRSSNRLLLSTLAVTGALALPATGLAGNHNPNVETTLAATLDAAAATSAKSQLHVLVFGSNLAAANTAAGISARNDLDVLGAESVTATPAAIDKLSGQPGVTFVTLDHAVSPTDAGTAAPGFSATSLLTVYPLVDNVKAVWDAGVTGAGVGIAVIDSGVTPRRDFGDRLVQITLPTQDGTKLDDSVGHGSLVAGVAAGASANGKYVGIAPGAKVFAINVARADGVYTSDVIAGLRWVMKNAAANKIRVVELSLTQTTPSQYLSSTLDAAVEKLWKQGVVVVVSSGNLGADSMLYAPANDPFAIAVGASDANDTETTADDTLATFSSFGQTQAGYDKPELVAPGRHVFSTAPAGSAIARSAPAANVVVDEGQTYLRMNGTSFSAPQVAGAVALLLQQRPDLSPDQVKWILTQSARPLTGSNAGALDVAAASALLAGAPQSANAGIKYTNWGRLGAPTAEFTAAISAALRAAAYERAAGIQERSAATACAKPPAASAKPKDVTAFWTKCASGWASAAGSWDEASEAWGEVPSLDKAAAAAKHAGDDWKAASDAYRSGGKTDEAMSTWDAAQAAWNRMSTWDHMSTWDMSTWDHMSTWDQLSTWDHLSTWD